ncbi:MAG: PKD repeat protein [Bacteroidia bacterium]|jgi:PKD repeat protein
MYQLFSYNKDTFMKKIFLFTFISLTTLAAFAQCTIDPFSLQKKVYISDLVVEGRVVDQFSFWNKAHSFIYTAQTLELTKEFQGNVGTSKNVVLITEGGTVGLEGLKVEPSLELEVGEVGLFFLDAFNVEQEGGEAWNYATFKASASVQSFIKYDEHTKKAHSYFETYGAIGAELYPKVEKYTERSYRKLTDLTLGKQGIKQLATPVISSWNLDTLASGTSTVLTINGSNFGIVKGNGFVEFIDPNFGDGRYFTAHYPSSYLSWSNSKIEVIVPTRSGTGKIRVTNNSNETGTSSDEIYIKYAHSNVGYKGTSTIDSGYFEISHIKTNSTGGYTWQFNTDFAKNTNATNSFLRALETWRCETLMNWDIGSNTTTDAIARDNENVVRFTTFGDSRLGVCYSWYNGCFNGGTVYWYVSELDIEFDDTRNWYYGTGSPGSSQYDFETVATHELGHGHQLSHVRDNTKIMHYSLSAGNRNVTLSVYDVEGGEYVRDKSKSGVVCNSSNKYTAISSGDCNITQPEAGYTISDGNPCPNTNISINDATKGKVKTYGWNFGTDASPATASTEGPHVVSYSSKGDKTITLIVSNDFGSDTLIKTVTVKPDKPVAPGAITGEDTACINDVTSYFTNGVEDAAIYNWSIGSGGNINNINDTSITVSWITSGNHTLQIFVSNSCGSSGVVTKDLVALDRVVANYSISDDGLEVSFTNTSSDAASYSWDFGDGMTSTEKDPVHTYTDKGDYMVTLTAENTCSDSTISLSIRVEFGVGIGELAAKGLKIYPNPAHKELTVESVNPLKAIVLYDQLGRKMVDQYFLNGVERTQLDVKKLSAGLYVIELIGADGSTSFGKIQIN